MANSKIVLSAEDRTAAAFASAKRNLGGLTERASLAVGTLAGLGSAVTLAGLTAMAKSIVDNIDVMNDLKDATGASIENISALENIARRTGGNFETVSTSLMKLNQALGLTIKPGSDAEKVLKAIGLNAKQLRDLDPAEALRQTAVALNQFADDGKKGVAVQLLFGKSLKEMAPLLKNVAEAGELVATITTQQAEEAEKFNKQLFAMQTAAGDLKRELALGLLPVMSQLLQNYRDIKELGSMDLILKDAAKGMLSLGFADTRMTGDHGGDINRILAERTELEKQLASAQRDGRGMHIRTLNEEIFTLNRYLEVLQVKQRNEILAGQPGDVGDAMSRRIAPRASIKLRGDDSAASRELAAQAKLLAELMGVQGDYVEQLGRLQVMRTTLNMSDAQYVGLVEEVIKKQPGAKKVYDEREKAEKEAIKNAQEEAKARAEVWVETLKQVEAYEKTVDSLAGQNQQMREDIELIGLSAEAQVMVLRQRNEILIITKEQELAAIQLADIESGTMSRRQIGLQEEIRLLRERGTLMGAKVEAEAAAKTAADALEAWKSTNKQIGDSFVDNLMRGGKSVAQYLKDLFRTLVLRPLLSPIGGLMAAGIGSLPTAANAAGSGMLGSLGGSALGSSVMGGLGMFGQAAGATMTNGLIGGFGANMANIGTLASGGQFMGALGGAAPYIGVALAAISLLKGAFKGETRAGGVYENGNFVAGPSGGEIGGDQVRQTIGVTMASINDTLKALGSTATLQGFVSGLEQSENGKGFAFAGGLLSTGAAFGQGTDGLGYMNRRGSMTSEEASAAFAEELKQATLQALQAADVPGLLGDYLRGLGDIDTLSTKDLDAALERINTALAQKQQIEAQLLAATSTDLENLIRAREAERAAIDESQRALWDQARVATERRTLEEQLFELTATDMEKLARTRELERAAVDETNRALLEQVYAQEDLARAADAVVSALDAARAARQQSLDSVGDAFAFLQTSVGAERQRLERDYQAALAPLQQRISDITASVQRITSLAGVLRTSLAGFATDATLGMTRGAAAAQIAAALATARATGQLPDPDSLQTALAVVSQPSEQLYSSFVDYAKAFDAQVSTISELNDLTEGQRSTEKRALAAAEGQLQSLNAYHADSLARLDAIVAGAQAELAALNGNTAAITSVAQALALFNNAASAAKTVTGGGGGTGALPRLTDAQIRELGASLGDNPTAAQIYQLAWQNRDRMSLADLDRAARWEPGASSKWAAAQNLPSFDAGIGSVPFDMTARVHRGERILPDSDNAALTRAVERMAAQIEAQARQIDALITHAFYSRKHLQEMVDRGVGVYNAPDEELAVVT